MPHYENVPFKVPKGWAWTTVAEISKSILYGVSEPAKTSGAYKLLRITDIQENNVDWDTVPFTDYDESKVDIYLLEENDILFARTGATVGKSYLVKGLCESSIYASYLIRVQTFKEILPQYVKYFFESGFYWEQIDRSSVGIGQPNVNGTTLGNLRLPIPPINEQERIVSELKKRIAVITSIEANKNDLQGCIESAKSKIIDLAIHGKLVPQDPNDEPAIELLRRINSKFTPCDNGQYGKMPLGWQLCTIGDVFLHNTGKALNKSTLSEGQLLPYITTSNVYWNRFELEEVRQMYFKDTEVDKCTVRKGDLLVCEGGDIGRSAIWEAEEPICIQNHIHRLRGKDSAISHRFYLYVMMLYKAQNMIKGQGIGLLGLSSKALDKMIVPCPPAFEQQRIVARIEELFATLDKIQNSLEA